MPFVEHAVVIREPAQEVHVVPERVVGCDHQTVALHVPAHGRSLRWIPNILRRPTCSSKGLHKLRACWRERGQTCTVFI
eukprot:388699-Rhodomonas_salina.1